MELEKIATNAVETSIVKTDRLTSFISRGDKEPCWDGNIYIHESKLHNKKNIKKVSTQVKGKAATPDQVADEIKYRISHDDLTAYMMNGGTMFFVVYINKDTGDPLQIYYTELLPIKIKEILRAKKITVANAAIMYNSHEGISLQKATNTVSVSFLGSFIFELNPTGATVSTAGLKYMTWIGHTDKNETEFMEYFNQEQYLKELEAYESGQSKKRPNPEHRCQFCKDLGIKFYYPEFLRIKIDKTCTMNSVQLIQSVIIDNNVLDCWVEKSLNRNGLNNASNNCTFCYIPNGFRDKKKNQKVFILKENMKGHLGIPKKYVEEIADYNGLRYLSTFEWE